MCVRKMYKILRIGRSLFGISSFAETVITAVVCISLASQGDHVYYLHLSVRTLAPETE